MIFTLLHGKLGLKQPIIYVHLVRRKLKNRRLMQRNLVIHKNVSISQLQQAANMLKQMHDELQNADEHDEWRKHARFRLIQNVKYVSKTINIIGMIMNKKVLLIIQR